MDQAIQNNRSGRECYFESPQINILLGRLSMSGGKLNFVVDFINTICNFFILNVVFLITCLPIFTIGAAISSLYYVTLKETKGEYGYLVRTYLRELKRNFKNGTIAFLILFPVGGILVFNLLFWPARGTALSSAATGLLIVLSIVYISISHYTYPLIGRFVNTPVNSIKNAWGLAVRNFKWTLVLLLIDACTACFCLFISLGPVLMLAFSFGFVFLAYIRSFIFNKIFAPYEKTEEYVSKKRQSILREHADMMTGTSQF